MAQNDMNMNIPKEKFRFIHDGDRIHDKKFENKPVGYLKDAWIRFRKSRAAVIATVIIILIILYAFITPLLYTNKYDQSFKDTYYAKKPARVTWMRENLGIMDGGSNMDGRLDAELVRLISIGMGAESWEFGSSEVKNVTAGESMSSAYQPLIKIGDPKITINEKKQEVNTYDLRVDNYLEVGFLYVSIEQSELQNILDFQEESGLQVLYPLVENNDYNPDPDNANVWYKARREGYPISVKADGSTKNISYSENMVLEENYKRDADGNLKYYEYTGGGDANTAQFKIRVLYYNYYQYLNGFEPCYIMGTDAQGYDMALRVAGGIKLSLLIAVFVSVINFIIGAIYGAIEGYYGGWIDLTLERVSDILNGVPFIVVATLFQLHLSAKLGALPSLLFAFVLTGWIGTAYRVRTQFYRFKNQEYVMAARTLGAKDRRIIWKHIFPNTLGTLITSSALVIPSTIMSESMLSFLGIVSLGGSSGTSLGTLLSDAQKIWINYPHLMLIPAIVISLLMICFNLFGNGLRDAFNPALRGVEE